MKKFIYKNTGILVLVFGLLTVSCSKDESTDVVENSATEDLIVTDTRETAEADAVSDGVFNLIEIAYAEQEENAGRNQSLFPNCVTITISMENGVKFVTLDFGFGCQLGNGAVVSGIINLVYGPVQNGTRTINYSFDNFVYNEKQVAGGGTIFRERNNAGGNPQSTVHKNLQITFPVGLVVGIDGTRVAEWIEGVGSGTWTDNVFLITGNRTVVTNTGNELYGIVVEPLRREATCQFFVSGTIDITRNGNNGVLDFGDGTCDNIAILTVNGEEYIIYLD